MYDEKETEKRVQIDQLHLATVYFWCEKKLFLFFQLKNYKQIRTDRCTL